MKPITKAAWNRVIDKACDIVNATMADEDDPMIEIYTSQLMDILDDLENEFGIHPETLDTRGDYLDDPSERRRLYQKALRLAEKLGDLEELEVCRESLRQLDEELKTQSVPPVGKNWQN